MYLGCSPIWTVPIQEFGKTFLIFGKRISCEVLQKRNGATVVALRFVVCGIINYTFSTHSEGNDDVVQKCLDSVIKLIRLVYDEVQSLEQMRLPEHIESKYQPLEDLNDCVYFQRNVAEFNADDIKVSQFLHFIERSFHSVLPTFRNSSTFICIFNRNY